MLKEFRQFILRGNLVDLAVAVVIGAAAGAVITSLVENLLTPLIAAILGSHHFSGLTFTINGSVFRYGAFLNALISFVTIAAAVFFFVVKPVNALLERVRGPVRDELHECPQCLSEIPVRAARCAYCTAELAATA